MNNAFARIGRTCASLAMAGGLMAGVMLAASGNNVTVTLPQAVTVGSTVMPSGQYTISTLDMTDGNEYFLMRSENGPAITLQAQKIDQRPDEKTQVVLTKDGNAWHLDKLFIRGEGAGYRFVNSK